MNSSDSERDLLDGDNQDSSREYTNKFSYFRYIKALAAAFFCCFECNKDFCNNVFAILTMIGISLIVIGILLIGLICLSIVLFIILFILIAIPILGFKYIVSIGMLPCIKSIFETYPNSYCRHDYKQGSYLNGTALVYTIYFYILLCILICCTIGVIRRIRVVKDKRREILRSMHINS